MFPLRSEYSNYYPFLLKTAEIFLESSLTLEIYMFSLNFLKQFCNFFQRDITNVIPAHVYFLSSILTDSKTHSSRN